MAASFMGRAVFRRPAAQSKVISEPAEAEIYPAARKAILAAQLVIVGPGSLYTSILANLLVPGVVQALRATTAHKIYVCNVMTQRGETDNYSAADHLRVLSSMWVGLIRHGVN